MDKHKLLKEHTTYCNFVSHAIIKQLINKQSQKHIKELQRQGSRKAFYIGSAGILSSIHARQSILLLILLL